MGKYVALFTMMLAFAHVASAAEPLVSQLKKGQQIVVLKDIEVKAGQKYWWGTGRLGKSHCAFMFDGAVVDRVIPAGTVFTVAKATSWRRPISSDYLGTPAYDGSYNCTRYPECYGGAVMYEQTEVKFGKPTPSGFDHVRFNCNRKNASYNKMKSYFKDLVAFP